MKVMILDDNKSTGSPSGNFLKLLAVSNADYIMFSDQDDMWYRRKTEVTYECMKRQEKLYGKDTPILVHSDLSLMDEEGRKIASSFYDYQKLPREDLLAQLLIQNTVTGCTVMLNKAAVDLLKRAPEGEMVLMYDHYAAILVAATGHIAFKEDELKKLWDNCITEKYVDIILFQCYTGFRPQELGEILIENVDLDRWVIVGGMKTEAGKNRVVPIHEKIKGIVRSKYETAKKLGSEYLFNMPRNGDMKMSYRRYNYAFGSVMEKLGIEGHKPHDPRKTFVTLAKKYNMDEYAIKLVVGHYIGDITEKVYTERDWKWLSEEVNKIIVTVPSSVEEVIG